MFVNKKIIIFGASVAGINTCKIIEDSGMDVKCFVDNDANKWNRKVCNCDVLNPEYLTELNKEEYIVIIGSMYVDEIGKQLEKYGYKSGVFCKRKVQRIATKNTEHCHPIFSLFSRQRIG